MAARASSVVSNLDDPDSVNAFLARIGGSLVTSPEKSTPPSPPVQDSSTYAPVTASGHGPGSMDESREVHSGVSDCRAPPSTSIMGRAARAISTPRHGQTLEDDLSAFLTFAEKSQKGLKDSKHAVSALEERAIQKGLRDSKYAIPALEGSASQENFSGYKKKLDYQGTVLKSVRASGHKLSPPAPISSRKVEQEVPAKVSKADQPLSSQAEDTASVSTDTEPFPPLENTEVQNFVGHYNPAAASQFQSYPTHVSQKLKDLLVDEIKNTKNIEPTQSALRKDGRTQALDSTPTPKHLTEEELDDGKQDEQIKTLGNTQSPRTPRPASRKIILTGLPSNADYTLVASLLHGGILESFSLFTSDADITKHAAALFTEAEAAQKYYDMYPNGVQYIYGSKKGVALVEVAKECDAPSAVLQGHLEAGASRVVRVTGADEDWSMRALCKFAGGSNRKIESICDYWRNEVRTIDFLFTNISDAVYFRAQLLHDSEWQVCKIQFGEDPCGKATRALLEA